MERQYVEPVRTILTAARERIAQQPNLAKGSSGPVYPEGPGQGQPIKGEGVYSFAENTCAGMAIEEATTKLMGKTFRDLNYVWHGTEGKEWNTAESLAMNHFIFANLIIQSKDLIGTAYPFQSIAEWNDQPDRTKVDVVEAFDRALAELP